MDRVVRRFDGEKVRIQCPDGEAQRVIQEKLLDPFQQEIEAGWLSGGAAEEKVKQYLDFVGRLMIKRPADHGVQSEKAGRRTRNMEHPCAMIDFAPAGRTKVAARARRTVRAPRIA